MKIMCKTPFECNYYKGVSSFLKRGPLKCFKNEHNMLAAKMLQKTARQVALRMQKNLPSLNAKSFSHCEQKNLSFIVICLRLRQQLEAVIAGLQAPLGGLYKISRHINPLEYMCLHQSSRISWWNLTWPSAQTKLTRICLSIKSVSYHVSVYFLNEDLLRQSWYLSVQSNTICKIWRWLKTLDFILYEVASDAIHGRDIFDSIEKEKGGFQVLRMNGWRRKKNKFWSIDGISVWKSHTQPIKKTASSGAGQKDFLDHDFEQTSPGIDSELDSTSMDNSERLFILQGTTCIGQNVYYWSQYLWIESSHWRLQGFSDTISKDQVTCLIETKIRTKARTFSVLQSWFSIYVNINIGIMPNGDAKKLAWKSLPHKALGALELELVLGLASSPPSYIKLHEI